jgi:hypothetical protein
MVADIGINIFMAVDIDMQVRTTDIAINILNEVKTNNTTTSLYKRDGKRVVLEELHW